MKLLFDHNLSPRLVNRLADLYPDSNHLFNLNLDTVADSVVWQYARDNNFVIVTEDLESLIRSHSKKIDNFYRESKLGILILS